MGSETGIAQWYSGKAIFITGATGFMGKVLVEKLVRSCPDVGPIYILVRGKKDMLPLDRVHEIMSFGVFDKVRAMQEVHKRDLLVPISGDISLPELGISADDNRLLRDTVSVVFHLAATVKFVEPLRAAVELNFEGTRTLLKMCENMPNLSAFVHVSTAYSNCDRSIIEERVYPPPSDPDEVLNCLAGMEDDLLESVTSRLLGKHPNTYTFTKALAEHSVAQYSTKLPIVVVRPSIVSAAWKEPSPGWVDNWNGPTGLVLGIGKGLVKSVIGESDFVADLIPVDVCINLCIAAAWEIGTRESARLVPNVRVYNCVSRPYKPIMWGQFAKTIGDCAAEYGMGDSLTRPSVKLSHSRVKHTLINILELYPSIILADMYLWFLGKRPRYHRDLTKLNMLGSTLEFFTTHEFTFDANNVEELKSCLSSKDQVDFYFDIAQMNWENYITTYFFGIRDHLFKQNAKTIQTSKEQSVRWTLTKRVAQILALAIAVTSVFQVCPSKNDFWSNLQAFACVRNPVFAIRNAYALMVQQLFH